MSGSGSDEPAAPTDIVKFGDKLGTVVDGLRAMDLFSVRARGKGDKLATPKELEVIFNERVEALIEQLAPMEVRGLPVNSTELLVAAEGLFMDAQVGANPSTEPYFERVRDAEVAMRWAEVDRVQSESARNGALARYMGVRSLTNGANTVVEARVTGNALEIELLLPLGTGEWRLEHDERTVSGVLANTGGRVVTHDFAGNTPSWATDGDFSLLALVDAATGTRLPFANMLLAPAAR